VFPNVDDDTGWIHGVTLFGISTHYKAQEDGSLSLRLQGSRDDLPFFEQIAVVYEADLYPSWVPFCNEGEIIAKVSHADLVALVNLKGPMFSRQVGARFFGADCLLEHGKMVLIGHSVDSWPCPPIAWKPTGWFHDIMILKDFKAVVQIASPTHAKV
jgi:hypothetical protein